MRELAVTAQAMTTIAITIETETITYSML